MFLIVIMENETSEATAPRNSPHSRSLTSRWARQSWEQVIEKKFDGATPKRYKKPQSNKCHFEWTTLLPF